MDTFPRQYARTRRLTLGRPRDIDVATDGSRVAFLRTQAGDDPTTCLWTLHPGTGEERLIGDPRALGARAGGEVTPEERARRERARESAGGITSYAADPALRTAAFALGGALFTADLATADVRSWDTAAGVHDPRPQPSGALVAYTAGGALRVVGHGGDRLLAGDDDPDVSWGLAEFIAAEEMGRSRGFWWSPTGDHLAVARVDTTPVTRWHIADPADPGASPREIAYPAAGTANAEVRLFVIAVDGSRREVEWDRDAFPYLADVTWSQHGPLSLLVQARDQRTVRLLADGDAGTAVVHEQTDPAWVDLVPGLPAWLPGGILLTAFDDGGARRLAVDGAPVTPAGLHVRGVVDAADGVVFTASEEPEETHVWLLSPGSGEPPRRLSEGPGVHGAAAGGGIVVVVSSPLAGDPQVGVVGGPEIRSRAETPVLRAAPMFMRTGGRRVPIAVMVPRDHEGGRKLPVLMDPYGGPHAQRAVRAEYAHLQSQWLADQGFAVVVADGRGTPCWGPAWERAVAGDLAGPVLDDQVDALHAAAEVVPDLDLERVAIRGWSFGGYLAALAVLRRPDVFHAAVAGAPVTEWRLYDTHYTERYLGHPDHNPDAYQRSSLLALAPSLTRPLLIIHGLADDNVVAAHTLQLSRALLEAGRPHAVLPLSGVTHMTPQEVVAENLLLLQVAFLSQALGVRSPFGGP